MILDAEACCWPECMIATGSRLDRRYETITTPIDTPMARLDAAHRQHLVERYFPNASHQVIIFSTDTEVGRRYYADLKPNIARVFHLNYDEQNRRTNGEEGYFWKD